MGVTRPNASQSLSFANLVSILEPAPRLKQEAREGEVKLVGRQVQVLKEADDAGLPGGTEPGAGVVRAGAV